MNNGIKEAIEAMGVRVGKPLRGYEPAARSLKACERPDGAAHCARKGVRKLAVPVAQVEDARGKTGVAYFWNTGEFELDWR